MAAAKHTPGPWVAETSFPTDNATVHAVDDGGLAWPAPIADCVDFEGRRPVEEAQANARLIAAAPELLDLAKLLERTIRYEIARSTREGDDEGVRLKTGMLNFVRSVIAKAQGSR